MANEILNSLLRIKIDGELNIGNMMNSKRWSKNKCLNSRI